MALDVGKLGGYRLAGLLIGAGVLVFLFSIVLLPMNASGPPTGGPQTPPDAVADESAEEYRWRVEMLAQQEDARARVAEILASLEAAPGSDAAAQVAAREQLLRVDIALERAQQSHDMWVEAREASGEAPPAQDSAESSESGGGTEAVALIGAIAGLITAVAGLIAALVTLLRPKQPAPDAKAA